MTSKCFYSPAKSECKEKRHIYSVTLWHSTETLLCNRGVTQATELAFWSNTLYTHTHLVSPKCESSFRGRRRDWTLTPTFVSHGTLGLCRLIDCYCATGSTSVQASRPKWRGQTRAVPPGLACTLMRISLPRVCTILPFDLCLSGFTELSKAENAPPVFGVTSSSDGICPGSGLLDFDAEILKVKLREQRCHEVHCIRKWLSHWIKQCLDTLQ